MRTIPTVGLTPTHQGGRYDHHDITKQDWIKDTIWTEARLTPAGWVKGTKRTEKGRYEHEVEAPAETLMTIRCLEFVPADPLEKHQDWTEIRWCSSDLDRIERAQEDWGVLPHWAPPLSSQSAEDHSALRKLPEMKLSDLRRPIGRRLKKRWPWSR